MVNMFAPSHPLVSPVSKQVCEFINLNPFLEQEMFDRYFRYFIGKRRTFMYGRVVRDYTGAVKISHNEYEVVTIACFF